MPTVDTSKKNEDHRKEILKNMITLLSDLSDMCRYSGWHKSGLHIFIAAEELQKMIDSEKMEQDMYYFSNEVKKNDETALL